MTDKGFRVTVEDLESGETGIMLVSAGDYIVIPFAPCELVHTQRFKSGAVSLNLRGHHPQGGRVAVDPADVPHVARRGTDVEAWIKAARDRQGDGPDFGGPWSVVDELLDDYRLHADVGEPLSTPAEQIGPGGH